MAGRTSTSFGVGATIAVLGLLSLTFFVLTAVYFNKYYDRQRQVDQAQAEAQKFVRPDERNRDDVLTLVKEAEKNQKSLVGYLVDSQSRTMEKVTGARRDTVADLLKKTEAVKGAETASLLSVISDRDQQIATLEANLKAAEAARQQAQADQQNEVARVRAIEKNHNDTVDALTKEVATVKAEVEQYRAGTNDYKSKVDASAESTRNEFAESRKRLEAQLAKLTDEKLIVEGQLAALRGLKNVETFRGRPEEALVDAEIIAVDGPARTAIISIGEKQRAVLGMTFAVYADANSIVPDAEGRYPVGKATLEIISIDDTSATCRITSELRGNPIVRGDVVANAMYDPNKTYKFVVFGNFDTDRDLLATNLERQDVEAMIINWGGKIDADLSGDADFVVLGERPLLPPRPGADAPLEVVQEFIRRQREVERYDGLQRQASSSSIPILNENRLYTLIGKTPARTRR